MKTPENSSRTRGDLHQDDEVVGEQALAWAVRKGADVRLKETARRLVRRRYWRQAIATCSVAMVGLTAVIWHSRLQSPAEEVSPEVAPFAVAFPETRILPDGSRVELREDAAISIDFSATRRRLSVVRGEARFEVVKDAERPFIVVAGDVEARAVGTAFFVSRNSASVEVLVTEGTVVVKRDTSTGEAGAQTLDAQQPAGKEIAAPVLVSAGARVVVPVSQNAGEAVQVMPFTAEEIRERHAWRAPRMQLSRTRLTQILPVFEKHSGIRIVLADQSLSNLAISGVLRADNVESLVRLLEIEFGVRVVRHGASEIVLGAGESKANQ